MTKAHQPIIWHIAAWWPTKEKPGNGLFIREHIRSVLGFARHKVVYLKIEKSTRIIPAISIEERSSDIDEFIVRIKTPIRRFGIDQWLINKGYEKVFRLMKSRFDEPKLIHIHVRSHLTKHAIAQIRSFQYPMVLSEHFSFYHRGIKSLSATGQATHRNEIRDFFQSSNLKSIMPVSRELADVMVDQFGAPKDRITVIPNIADACFAYAENEPTDVIRIALVAAWHYPKNPFVFFEAVQRLDPELKRSVQIDIIGHGSQLADMKSRINNDLNDVSITLHGYKKKSEFSSLLQQADFFVHPTDQENLPTVIAEALSCGTPVLSMNVNGIPEMVDAANGILVEPKDPVALKAGIEEMIRNRDAFDRKTIALDASEKYSKEVIGKSIENIYNRVLS